MSNASDEAVILEEPEAEAWARSQLYGLLARVFRAEPDAALLTHMKGPEFLAALGRDGARLVDFLDASSKEALIAELGEEHARLFLGPGAHVSLHESVLVRREGGLLWGVETADVAAFMREAGFDLSVRSGMIPDHLSVELEFMAHLCREEALALRDGDDPLCRSARSWQGEFLARHLGKWVGKVRDRTLAMRPSLFYEIHAALLASFVGEDLAVLRGDQR